ncbi:MAG: HlyD family efflux transporter periplasmic adaptor subunit [bacterium]
MRDSKMYRLKLIALVPTLGMLFFGCGADEQAPGGSGLLEATTVLISAETAGRVLALEVDEGDIVHAGDTVARIDPSLLELKMKAAQAGLAVARTTIVSARLGTRQAEQNVTYLDKEHERLSNLLGSGSATAQQVEKLEHDRDQARLGRDLAAAQLATAEAELIRLQTEIDRLQRLLDDCYPRSAIDGVVIEKFVECGEVVGPGKALVSVAGLDSMWVKVYLPAVRLQDVKLGDEAMVDTESGGLYSGRIVWLSDQAEFTPKNVQTAQARANLVYAVKVKLANSDGRLKIGMPVFVTLAGHESH